MLFPPRDRLGVFSILSHLLCYRSMPCPFLIVAAHVVALNGLEINGSYVARTRVGISWPSPDSAHVCASGVGGSTLPLYLTID